MSILTLQQAKDHLLLTTPAGDPGDADLTLKLNQAERFVFVYCSSSSPYWTDTVATWIDAATTPLEVQAAILVVLGELTRFRGDDPEGQGAPRQPAIGDVAPLVATLLRRYRDPVLA